MARFPLISPLVGGVLLFALLLAGCQRPRNADELRLKHEVTVSTPQGERTFSGVVSLKAYQSYNYHPGGSGWGAITARLTGAAVRIPVGEREFYVLLDNRDRSTPAWSQMELVKTHFGIPNYDAGRAWIGRWNALAASRRALEIAPETYPQLAVMPAGGWMDDARRVSLEEAAALGLEIKRYRLVITRERPSEDVPRRVRYRPAETRYPRIEVGRESFVAKDASA